MLMRAVGGLRWTWAGGAASGPISWRAAVLILAIVLASGVLRLFTEWQRRKTFMALISHAPEGTVITQQDGHGRQTMTVCLGDSRKWASQSSGDHG